MGAGASAKTTKATAVGLGDQFELVHKASGKKVSIRVAAINGMPVQDGAQVVAAAQAAAANAADGLPVVKIQLFATTDAMEEEDEALLPPKLRSFTPISKTPAVKELIQAPALAAAEAAVLADPESDAAAAKLGALLDEWRRR